MLNGKADVLKHRLNKEANMEEDIKPKGKSVRSYLLETLHASKEIDKSNPIPHTLQDNEGQSTSNGHGLDAIKNHESG